MKNILKPFFGIFLVLLSLTSCSQNNMEFNKLSPDEERVIVHKGTETPYTGKYYKFSETGTYICRRCNAPLYSSKDKFDSGCGWPSFDDEISGAIKKNVDADGKRTEIICNRCGAHLGHVFTGEGFTEKNTRHCVNSVSMSFIPSKQEHTETAIFAAGCFWGVEYYLQKAKGVISTKVGYIGGNKDNPSYEDVCAKTSGHAEAVEVIYNPAEISYYELVKLFFEIHDFTQVNRQGPDVGDQYRTEIFYLNDQQKEIALNLVESLNGKGYKVATKLTAATKFWSAETYHQNYYTKKGSTPYCHKRTKIF